MKNKRNINSIIINIIMIIISIIVVFTNKVYSTDGTLENVKSLLNIDTKLENQTFSENKIHIEGWKLSTISNTKLNVYLGNKKIDDKYIKYSYKYALTDIIKGYGTKKENPNPNFDIDVPLDDFKQGNYILKIDLVTSDENLLTTQSRNIKIDKGIRYVLNLDTNLNNETFDKDGIIIQGWKLVNTKNTKLNLYIDNNKVDEKYIKYSYKYALTEIVKGYGTKEQNEKPHFDINIPVENISNGKHKIRIDLVTEDNKEILETIERNINIDKTEKHILNIDTKINNVEFNYQGIKIEGWKLANSPNTKLDIYLDDTKLNDEFITYSYKYALTQIVKGYGNATDNPKPHFNINIPIIDIENGKHKLKIEFKKEDDTILEKAEYNIFTNKNMFEMHVESIFDRNSITNEIHSISGWMMSSNSIQAIKLLVDGTIQSNEFKRAKRQDVLDYFNNVYAEENQTPGFSTDFDFSKLSFGLHQLAVRAYGTDNILGEEVIYVFVRRKITTIEGIYGKSAYAEIKDERGSELKYFRYGDGPNVLFTTFSVHGFEDNWDHDGEELTYIANKFYETLKNNHSEDYKLANKWTIYIFPCVNPDGQKYGTTNNGPGRTTMYSAAPNHQGIDLNRCWKYTGFEEKETSRNYAGTAPFQAYEAKYLRDFLISNKSKIGQTILIDLHGWFEQLIGDREIGMYYAVQFPTNNGYSLDRYGDGYLIDWARMALANDNGKIARTALIELPDGSYNHQSVVNRKFAEKYINATLSMLNGIL